MSRENVEIVRSVLAALNRGDFDAAFKDAAVEAEADLSRAVGLDCSVYSIDEFRRLAEQFDATWDSVLWGHPEARQPACVALHLKAPTGIEPV